MRDINMIELKNLIMENTLSIINSPVASVNHTGCKIMYTGENSNGKPKYSLKYKIGDSIHVHTGTKTVYGTINSDFVSNSIGYYIDDIDRGAELKFEMNENGYWTKVWFEDKDTK